MLIYPEIELEWKGKVYQIRATMRLINRIEQRVSLASLAQRMSNGDVPLSHLAVIFSEMLNGAGANTDVDEVFAAMLGEADDETEVDQTAVITAAAECLKACFPESDAKKKKAPEKGKSKSKKPS